jgi:DNA-binding NarL/FixJ family response regulator
MPPLRTLIVDNFEDFRRYLSSILKRKTQCQVVGQASDGLEAVEKAEELQPDLILLDLGLPKLNGMEAARRIRELSPNSKILFLSQDSSPEIVEEALRLGAQGYLLKSEATELPLAVDAITQGTWFVSRRLKRNQSQDGSPPVRPGR